ncbi:MAG: hypothetical protein LBE91_03025 [Tannerella sp.]|jgi:hypothetical protein|nr:hypothetical protein [Tannerella sp.]
MNSLFDYEKWEMPDREVILKKIDNLRNMHKLGLLGGEIMPEDANPKLDKGSAENYHYFTLPMALNYQRNSYKLWPAATNAYKNAESRKVFTPKEVCKMNLSELRDHLVHYKIALQPNKHVEIWKTICDTIVDNYDGDIRNLFTQTNGDIKLIKEIVQEKNKKGFPYLSGSKICNYWLYVMGDYTSAKLINRQHITVAPDTHVMQSTFKLGLINPKEKDNPKVREMVSDVWNEILKDTSLFPIDIHTPLWLWSRGGFTQIVTIEK